ncbi:hypothetical protein Tco_1516892, partial [Tanacetum coccineum]
MGSDTIQLEDAVSTISQEYLLEFLSEYFIPENLHPELVSEITSLISQRARLAFIQKKLSLQTIASPSRNFYSTSSDTTKSTVRNYR